MMGPCLTACILQTAQVLQGGHVQLQAETAGMDVPERQPIQPLGSLQSSGQTHQWHRQGLQLLQLKPPWIPSFLPSPSTLPGQS